MADPATIPLLIEQLRLKDDIYEKFSFPAQKALVAIGPAARDALVSAMNGANNDVRDRITWVLDRIKQ
jgi:hypothetical protein